MKKRFIFLVISLCIFAIVGGCSKKDNTKKSSETKTTVTPTATATKSTATKMPKKGNYVLSKYIKLGKYKGIEVAVDKITVTEDEIKSQITSDLQSASTEEEVKDRAIKKGDIANIDYEGLKDGVAFEGGTAKGYDLEIGSGQFIDGFEDKLIGAKVGDKLKLDLTFPKNYGKKELAGAAVVFNVTVNKIKTKKIPTVEEYVKEKTNYKTVDEYKASVKEKLEKQKEDEKLSKKQNDVITSIVNNSKISSLPKTLLTYYKAEMDNYYKQYAAMMNQDLDTLLKSQGMTKEVYDKQVKDYAKSRATLELVLQSIIKAEKIKLTDKEYKDGVAKILSDNKIPSEAELYKQTPKNQVADQLLWQKTINFVTDNAIEK